MIVGIGTDICSINRFEDEEKRAALMARFYTENERTYIESRGKGAAASAAAVFAAKEACAKALGTGFRGFGPLEIEVVHNEDGKPTYRLLGEASLLARRKGVDRTHLSLSHDGGLAAAFAVLEGRGRRGGTANELLWD